MKDWRRELVVAAAVAAAAGCSAAGGTAVVATTTATPAAAPASTTATSPAVRGPSGPPGSPAPATTSPRTSPGPTPSPVGSVAIRPALTLQAPGRLPDEGVFHTAVTRDGQPVLQVAHLRADPGHGRDETGVVWIDQQVTRFELHPGWADPGHLSQWNQPDLVPVAERGSLLATFNGGFKTPELRGGFYENGHTAGKLLPGLASVVIGRDGRVTLGAWGTEVAMSSDVVAVRQNLHLLIDHHQITPGLDTNVESNWGPILGTGPDAWRSGVGITATGDFVLVMGDALTPQTLANLLLDAGSVRAMEMDINPAWMSFMWYTAPGRAGTNPTPHKLIDFQRPADRYFTHTSRDFFALYLR